MKFEEVNGWRMAGRVAASLVLGAVATAQTAGGETSLVTKKGIDLTQVSLEGDIRDTSLVTRKGIDLTRVSLEGDIRDASLATKKGIELTRVSLEGDIRTAEPARGMIILQRPAGRELELVFKLHPLRNSGAGALIPTLEDMESSLVLRNGTPGAVAVIHLESRAPELRRAKGTRIVGFFDDDGKFEGPLPQGFKPRGIFAHGQEVTWFGLVKKPVSGHAVPASERPVMEEVDLEELVDEAYGKWVEHETLPSSPQGGRRAGEKIPLQRPRKPVQGGGHTKPGTDVDKDLKSGSDDCEVYVEPANPTGGRRAGKKIELHRPPTQRDDKVLERRL